MDSSVTLDNFELTRFFFVIVLLLLLSHTCGYLFERFRLPRVIGEILGGLLLGPTVLGYFIPDAHLWLFAAFESEGKLLSLIYWLGLVLLMFVSGFEIQKSLSRKDNKIIIALTLGSTILPFIAGWLAPSLYDFSPYIGERNNTLALQLIIAIATAVTSIPVISKIFIDLKITETRFAKIVLSTATIHDVILWIALAIATGLVTNDDLSISPILYTVLITILFFGVSILIIPKIINYLNRSRYNLLLKSSVGGYILFVCFLFSAIASILDVNIVFGALLAGIVIGILKEERFEDEKKYIKQISLSFFTPLYFGIVGLKLDLIHHFDLSFFLIFLCITTIFQLMGTLISAKLMKNGWLSSFNLSVAMITKGGPGIVLATIAFELGIINETFFVTLVLIAIVTSLLAGTWFKYILVKGYELLESE
jgi:Kef-type K+ transport system membrane component KefB